MEPLFKMGDRVRLTQKGLGGYSVMRAMALSG